MNLLQGKFLDVAADSIFGRIDVYNLPPQKVMDCKCVRKFQRMLHDMLNVSAAKAEAGWECMFSPLHPLHLHPLRRLSRLAQRRDLGRTMYRWWCRCLVIPSILMLTFRLHGGHAVN